MRQIFSFILLCSFLSVCLAYNAFPRSSGSSDYSYSRYGSSDVSNCCALDSWTYDHIDEVRQFANRLRALYNSMSQGSSLMQTEPWRNNILELTQKTSQELDALSRTWAEQLVMDMKSGSIDYSTVVKPNFFEYKSSEILRGRGNLQILNVSGHFQPLDLTDFDEVKNYAYPAEVKVINGKTYVVHKNCTEASKTIGEGTMNSPLITVRKRNRTIITSPGSDGNFPTSTGNIYAPSTIGNRHLSHHIYNFEEEPSVMDYRPSVTLDSGWTHNINPLPFTSLPEQTITVRRYNETVIKNSDGTNVISGSELKRKWVDGRLVYDELRPFGSGNMPSSLTDEAWKREERERLFWILNDSSVTAKTLEMWQHQQEERLLALAHRYHITIEEIQNWHHQELERFKQLIKQYNTLNIEMSSWKQKECARLDWLIHQNSMTREELERWQRENLDKLNQLAKRYAITLAEFKTWQNEELQRLYIIFQEQNNSMIPSGSLQKTAEQERLEALIREHNATIAQLQNSIHMDQQKLMEFKQNYRGNVEDMEKWLKSELARLTSIINEQRNELTRITEWQNSERQRLTNLLQSHQGSIAELEAQMGRERNYIQSLASKYHVSIEELEKWQKAELTRLQMESKNQMELNVKAWQAKEHENLMSIIKRNDLTIEEFQTKILSDRARLEQLARTYKVQVSEIEDWFKKELKNFQNQGLLKEVEKQLTVWQENERQRLLKIVSENTLSMEDLEKKIQDDQSHLYKVANQYQIRVEELEEWLKKEFKRLQSEGLIKVEDLKDWQRSERQHIMQLVQQNKLTIEEFEQKLLKDRARLQQLSNTYNVEKSELEAWLREEGKRLQQLGFLQLKEQLSQWQQIERERLRSLVEKNKLTLGELEERISKDQTHLYSLAYQHQVRVEEIEEWIKQEIKKLQEQGLLEMAKLKNWQVEWRGNLTNMVQERDFTVEEFHKWLLDDRSRLQSLAKTHNVQIEEIEQWVKNEEQRFVSLGLLKPNEKLTNWQEAERRYLENIAQEQHYRSTEQLELRLRQDRELLEQLARQYSVQVEEIQTWMKKELQRLRDEGQLQIDNLAVWQLAERERLEALIAEKKQWNLSELEATLRQDREHMQKLAFQYHTSMEEIEKWLKSEISRLEEQGKIEIKHLTEWQLAEQNRIMNLLANQSSITETEFERKVQQDYAFLQNLANEYHVSVMDIESYVKKVIDEMKLKGQFEMKNLQAWQVQERQYIEELIAQYHNKLTTEEIEQKLRSDRVHLHQLASQYRISIDQIEKYMLEELKRLRNTSETEVIQLSKWQEEEIIRMKQLLHEKQHLDYIEYEIELMKERERIENLAREYAVSVTEIENWLRQQLLNLKTSGEIQVESLTKWQTEEQKRLIELLLQQQQNGFTFEDFEQQLQRNESRFREIATNYSLSVEQIELWMRNELQRLQNSGLVQVEHLNQWQQAEKARLEQWLRQLNHNVTYTELLEFLQRDQRHMHEIAREYQITVEEVQAWVQLEAARLQFLNAIKQPDSQSLVEENALWKMHTKAHLRGIAMARPNMSWQEFEEYLQRERMRWQQLAMEYHITVEEIETWLRQAANELQSEGLIQLSTPSYETWQLNEQKYIQNLINEALRKNRHQWTMEELECWLVEDTNHLRQLIAQYHITEETIMAWYRDELQRLLNQQRILKEYLEEWKILERKRIYNVIFMQPTEMRTQNHLQQILIGNASELNRLALKYKVTVEELKEFIIRELQHLTNLGILNDNADYLTWQEKERKRLREIASKLFLTKREMLEFISLDRSFQMLLSKHYGCAANQLAPFQSVEIEKMQKEMWFENRHLITLEPWQIKERDLLYSFIKNQNLSLKNLQDMQRQDIYMNELAAKYGIETSKLKAWQLQEFQRLMKIADAYRMSLYQLQDFREKELQRIDFFMHEELKTSEEKYNFNKSEQKRLQMLQRETELSIQELENWRRTLYLLCQGLIDFNTNGAGHDVGPNFTNRTAIPHHNISKDRGDQPPHIYDENLDGNEPGLAGQDPPYPGQLIDTSTTTQRTNYYPIRPVPGQVGNTGNMGNIESGYHYRKHEYKYTGPVIGASASASASASNYGSSASASINNPLAHGHERRHSNDDYDQQQQQQQEETEFFDQQQQQQQEEVNSENLEKYLQQQQQEPEEWGNLDMQQQQQQQEIDHFGQQQSKVQPAVHSPIMQAETEVKKEEPGFWGNLKKKTGDLFG